MCLYIYYKDEHEYFNSSKVILNILTVYLTQYIVMITVSTMFAIDIYT